MKINKSCKGDKPFLKLVLLWFIVFSVSCTSQSSENANSTMEPAPVIKVQSSAIPTPMTTQKTIPKTVENQSEENKQKFGQSSEFTEKIEDVDITFAIEKNNSPAPIAVLNHLKFSAGFGGGMSICDNQETWPDRTLFWSPGGPTSKDSEFTKNEPLNLEWQQAFNLSLCGLKPNEEIKYSINFPDGTTNIEKEQTAYDRQGNGKSASIIDYFLFPIGTKPGVYSISFTGDSWNLTRQLNLKTPETPRFYRLSTTNNENKYFLYNFQPSEELILLIYTDATKGDGGYVKELFDWKELKADDLGQLTFMLSIDYLSYWSPIIIGKESGEVHLYSGSGFREDNHNVQLPETGLEFFLPDESDIGNMRNILDVAGYKDIKTPATVTYSTSVTADEKISWTFRWCTNDYDSLNKNLENLSIEYYINDYKLDVGYISDRNTFQHSGMICRLYKVYLRGWEPGKEYKLELRYELFTDLSDGKNIYRQGLYRHIISVSVKS